MSNTGRFKTPEEAKIAVDKLSSRIRSAIFEEIRPYHPKDRWLVMTRAVNTIFSYVFSISVSFSTKESETEHDITFVECFGEESFKKLEKFILKKYHDENQDELEEDGTVQS